MAVPLYLTELGYRVDLISRGNHIGGRKHDLLINKNVSWQFQVNDRAPRGLLTLRVLIERWPVNSNKCRMDSIIQEVQKKSAQQCDSLCGQKHCATCTYDLYIYMYYMYRYIDIDIVQLILLSFIIVLFNS